MKTKLKKLPLFLITLAVLMTFIMCLTASAEITAGDFTIAPTDGTTSLTEGTDYSYSDGKLTISTATPVTLGMAEDVTSTSETVAISAASDAEITFSGIDISTDKESCIEVLSSAKTTLVFSGENKITTSHTDGTGLDASASSTDAVLNITSNNAGSISISGGQCGIFFDSYSSTQGLEISGNLKLDIAGCSSHAIRNKAGYVKINETPVIDIDTTEYGIYGVGIEISGGTFTLKNDSGYIICSADGNPITISNNADIHIIDADSGIRAGNSKITLTDSVQIKVFGGDENNQTAGIVDYAISSGELLIEENAMVDVFTTDYAISGGVTEISGNAKVNIKIDCESSYSRYAIRFDSPLNICDFAKVDININGTKVYGLYGITDGTANISGSAVVTINGAYRSVYADYLNLSGNAQMTINNDINYAVYGDTSIKDYAKFTATSTQKRVLYGDVVVTPADGKTYIVKAGASEADASEIGSYTAETSISSKSTWRYFNAELEGTAATLVSVTTSGVAIENLSECAILIVASYSNNQLVDTKMLSVSQDCEKTFTELNLNTSNADTVKAFLWKDMTDIKPLCSSDDTSL